MIKTMQASEQSKYDCNQNLLDMSLEQELSIKNESQSPIQEMDSQLLRLLTREDNTKPRNQIEKSSKDTLNCLAGCSSRTDRSGDENKMEESKNTNGLKSSSSKTRISLMEFKKQARAQNLKKRDITTEIYDPYKKTMDYVSKERRTTGLIHNEEYSEGHKCDWDPNYPENPRRLARVLEQIKHHKLYDRCFHLEPTPVSVDLLLESHSSENYNLLQNISVPDISKGDYELLSSRYDAIFINQNTFQAAMTAAGSCVSLVEAILTKTVQNGMACVRPPGHHAMFNEFNGYCIFNNAVIAAKYAIQKHNLDRILIVDLDVHHGQGVQRAFFNDNKVLYFSVHRYEHGLFWPNLRQSDYDYVGDGKGTGFNFNVPLNVTEMTNYDYLTIYFQVLLPLAYEGEMLVTPTCYAHMVYMLQAFAEGKVAVFLEGGYNLDSLAEGAALTLSALLDDPVPSLGTLMDPKASLLESISNCVAYHKRYWSCFKHFGGDLPDPIEQIPIPEVDPTRRFETRNCYPEPLGGMNILIFLETNNTITVPTNKVAIIYDEEMLKHNKRDGTVPLENPERLKQTYDLLVSTGILRRCHVLESDKIPIEIIDLIHTAGYVEELKKVIDSEDDSHFTSVYTNEYTLDAALIAVGSSLKLLHNVMSRKSHSGFALIRPPGHHAEPANTKGFCIFNNVGFVAKAALNVYHLDRILIVDFDVHHPNGTYEIFKSDSRCLLISIHRYGNNFFPNTGSMEEVGIDTGEGFNVNIPFSKGKQGDAEYLSAFLRVVLPIAKKFNPELVLVSAGFDAAVGDPLGQYAVSPEMFGHITHMLKGLASGKLVMFLEGGYNTTSVSYSVLNCIRALLGDPLIPLKKPLIPNQHAIDVLDQVIDIQQKYWPVLKVPKYELSKPKKKSLAKTDYPYAVPKKVEEEEEEKVCYTEPTECPHLDDHIHDIPEEGVDLKTPCVDCQGTEENWICLTCYQVGCSQYMNSDMKEHAYAHGHPLVLSFSDLSIWCYSCDQYVDNDNLYEIKNAFHIFKFNKPIIPY